MDQFTYHRDVEDDPVVNAVAGGDDPAGVEQRGPAGGGLQASVVKFNFFPLKPFLADV